MAAPLPIRGKPIQDLSPPRKSPQPKGMTKPLETVDSLAKVLDRLRDPFAVPMGRGSMEEAVHLTEQIHEQLMWLLHHKEQHAYGRQATLGPHIDYSADPDFHANNLPPPIAEGAAPDYNEKDIVRPLAIPLLRDGPFASPGGQSERTISFDQTSEVYRTNKPRPRRQAAGQDISSSSIGGGLTASMSSPGLLNSSSVYAYRNAKLPLVLPGKMHWVRDTHRRLGALGEGAAELARSQSLQTLGMPSLPSELFFGEYGKQKVDVISQAYGADREGKGAMPELDSYYSHWTEKRRVEAENRHKNWGKRYSFDRISQNGVI